MKSVTGLLLAVILVGAACVGVAQAQNGPKEGLAARCRTEFVQDRDRLVCEAEGKAAEAQLSPIIDFIVDGEYAMQTLVLGGCLEATKDHYGQDYSRLAACYDAGVTRQCADNQRCLSNSTIAGIQRHIAEGTKP